MEEQNDNVQLFRDNLPQLYDILDNRSEQYTNRTAAFIRTYPLSVARLLAHITVPMNFTDYRAWELTDDEYIKKTIEVFGTDDTTNLGRIGRLLRSQNNAYNYTTIMDTFTDMYFDSNGAEPAPISNCIAPDSISNNINRSAHNTATLKEVASIMSTMNQILPNSGYDVTTPYDALFSVRRLGATTGAISEVYLVRYMDTIPMIMKTNTRDYNFQLHEYIVGLRMNELRDTIANFVYTYGYSKVLNPIFNDVDSTEDPSANFIAFGLYDSVNLTDRQVYIEYLNNAVTLADTPNDFTVDVYLRKMQEFPRVERLSGSDVFEVLFLQIMSAIFYAWKRTKFAHRDLNAGNIMLVNLNQITAIPIMVPAGIDEQTGDIIFIRRWIMTDILVVIIDYGFSSIEIPEFRDIYSNRVISPISVYGLFEGITTIENDFVNVFRSLHRKFGAVPTDFIDIVSLFYTGQSATQDMYQYYNNIRGAVLSLSGGSYIYPELPYYIERTLIKYCVKYSNKWTSPDYDSTMFRSILGEESSTSSTESDITITDSRQMYLALIDETEEYNIDFSSVIANEWYRNTYVEPSLQDTDKTFAYITWMMKFFKWTNTFPMKLNMQPLSYDTPLDFVRRAYAKTENGSAENVSDNRLIQFARDEAKYIWRY